MSKLTDEQVEYIREWAASGNEWREAEHLRAHSMVAYWMVRWNVDDFCQLSPAGLTIAAQAEENARLTAERDEAIARAEKTEARVDGLESFSGDVARFEIALRELDEAIARAEKAEARGTLRMGSVCPECAKKDGGL